MMLRFASSREISEASATACTSSSVMCRSSPCWSFGSPQPQSRHIAADFSLLPRVLILRNVSRLPYDNVLNESCFQSSLRAGTARPAPTFPIFLEVRRRLRIAQRGEQFVPMTGSYTCVR